MFIARNGKYLALLLVLVFSFCIVQYRVYHTGAPIFRFFWWNLLLAVIPWWSSEAMRDAKGIKVLFLGLLTVLFLPNAPYMITDLFHLRARAEFPLWYDALLVFWFALVGVLLFYLSLFNIERAVRRYANSWGAQLAVAAICFLCGFGIYLGRYLRFNSWDVMTNYDVLGEEILDQVINLSRHTRTVGVTLLYGGFLYVGWWIGRLYGVGERGK